MVPPFAYAVVAAQDAALRLLRNARAPVYALRRACKSAQRRGVAAYALRRRATQPMTRHDSAATMTPPQAACARSARPPVQDASLR